MNRKCIQCGKDFKITESEVEFYKSKNLELPKRCLECRKRNRKKQTNKKTFLLFLAFVCVLIGSFFEEKIPKTNDQSYIAPPSIEQSITYTFKNTTYLENHFEKHKDEFDYANASEYLQGANNVIMNPDALYKIEEEDGDGVYYLESTNELVILSTEGYIRTYFKPTDGIEYFKRT